MSPARDDGGMTGDGTSTPARLEVEIRTDGGLTVVAVSGDLDAYSVSALRDSIARLETGTDTVFDLSGVPFIDSAGLGALIAAVRRVREGSGRPLVVSSRANVVRLLRISGFDRIAPVHATIEAATA